jgi:hypothetical protein
MAIDGFCAETVVVAPGFRRVVRSAGCGASLDAGLDAGVVAIRLRPSIHRGA